MQVIKIENPEDPRTVKIGRKKILLEPIHVLIYDIQIQFHTT